MAYTYTPQTRDQYMQNQQNVIDSTYNQSKNALNESYQATMPTYQQNRNAASLNAAQSGRKLNELMAAKGLSRGGSFMTQQANINNQRGSQLADINRDQGLYQTQYNNRMNELEQARSAATSQASLGYENYGLNAAQLANQQAMNEANVTGLYNGQQTLAAQQLAQQQKLAQASLLANLIGQYSDSTGNWTTPTNYSWGDLMKKMFSNIGY